jgi:hypothetical protein
MIKKLNILKGLKYGKLLLNCILFLFTINAFFYRFHNINFNQNSVIITDVILFQFNEARLEDLGIRVI